MFYKKTILWFWAAVFCSASFGTEIYTWVDEKKVTHFSQFPPAGQNANKIPLHYKPAKSSMEAKVQIEALRKEAEESEEGTDNGSTASKEKEEKALIQLRCEKAKQELAFLEDKSTPEITGASGDTRLLTQTEKKQRLLKATTEIETFCY